jgi:hypothetical protein
MELESLLARQSSQYSRQSLLDCFSIGGEARAVSPTAEDAAVMTLCDGAR